MNRHSSALKEPRSGGDRCRVSAKMLATVGLHQNYAQGHNMSKEDCWEVRQKEQARPEL